MLVCHCRGVNEKRILQVVREGARCPEDVARACGAGTGCGGCLGLVEEIVEGASESTPDLPTLLLSVAGVSG